MKKNETPATIADVESAKSSTMAAIEAAKSQTMAAVEATKSQTMAAVEAAKSQTMAAVESAKSATMTAVKTMIFNLEESTKRAITSSEAALRSDMRSIVDRIDYFIGQSKNMNLEQAAQAHQIKDLRESNADHERRISALEGRRQV